MKNVLKKITFLLVLVFTIVFIPGYTSYSSNIMNQNNTTYEEEGYKYVNQQDGKLELNKEVKQTHKNYNDELNDRSYDITLNVNAKKGVIPKPDPQDIILVLDQSGSMNHEYDGVVPFNALKESVSKFSRSLLENSNVQRNIEVIGFSGLMKLDIIGKHSARYYLNGKYHEASIVKHHKRNYVKIDHRLHHIIYNPYGKGEYYTYSLKGNDNDAHIIQPFTNNYKEITSSVNKQTAIGGTDTESAINLVSEELLNLDQNSQKYVIFFTDGLPSLIHGRRGILDGSSKLDEYINVTENTFKDNLLNLYGDKVKFISLGFRSVDSSSDSEVQNKTDDFLSCIQNYNVNINESMSNGKNKSPLIFINNPKEIDNVYNVIANDIKKYEYLTTNATVRDILPNILVPDNIKESDLTPEKLGISNIEPEGYKFKLVPAAQSSGNKKLVEIYWDNQKINEKVSSYKFTVHANNKYFGENNVPGNEYADVTYTDEVNSDNSKFGQKFNIPTINVPNECSMDLNDKTVIYGDKVNLKDLINNINIKYGPDSGYTYTWTDEGTGEKINLPNYGNRIFNPQDKSIENYETPFYMKDNDKFNLKITNDSLNNNQLYNELDKNLNKTSNITVLKPTITVVKKVVGDDNQANTKKDKFTFNISGGILDQSWNMSIKENTPFTINNITRGVYKLNEIASQGYDLQGIKINGKEVNKDSLEFVITDAAHESEYSSKYKNDPIIVVNKDNLNINIEITNKKKSSNYYNDSETIENKFVTNKA